MKLNKCMLGDVIAQRREKNTEDDLPIRGVSREGLIMPKQQDADSSIYNVFYRKDFVFNPARMELNSIAYNDQFDKAICSSLYEIFYVSREDIILPEYLKLIVKQDWFTRYCEFIGSGSAREYCRFANISEIEIEFPELEVQEKIVGQYKVVKDRIHILKQINDNLEATAHAIYKKLFVDDINVSSIPIGWKIDILGNVAEVSAGGDKPYMYSNFPTDICTVPIFSNGIAQEGLYGYTDKAEIYDESITVSARGTVGYVFLREEPYVPIVRLISVIPDKRYMTAKYLYFALSAIDLQSTGTSQQQITIPDFKKRQILVPNRAVLDDFTSKTEWMFVAIRRNKAELKALTAFQSIYLALLSL